MVAIHISINAPVKSATEDGFQYRDDLFQSTHPWRVRLTTHLVNHLVLNISINAPVKSVTRLSLFLSSRCVISINAPVKSATCDVWRCSLFAHISINAPVKSATFFQFLRPNPRHHFNQRTREECDFLLLYKQYLVAIISINAPVKSATLGRKFIQIIQSIFQSTYPWRVRRPLPQTKTCRDVISINAPVKSVTICDYMLIYSCLISINAPVKSATGYVYQCYLRYTYFNQRTREECDLLVWHKKWWHFNQRTREDCDISPATFIKRNQTFQSTHPCGVRLMFFNPRNHCFVFQSTHPCGVRHCREWKKCGS